MSNFVRVRKVKRLPRVPLEGSLDLTYRCNNICRHCWLWLSPNASEEKDELTFDEIRHIADQARAMGTRNWCISGGEPMIREDFPDIFDYLTRGDAEYSLNTNGTLITPAVARLLKRRGAKFVSLYGATAAVQDWSSEPRGSPVKGSFHLLHGRSQIRNSLTPGSNWQKSSSPAR